METPKSTEVKNVTLEVRYFTSKLAKAEPAFYLINKEGPTFKEKFTRITFLGEEAKAKVKEFEKGLKHGQFIFIDCSGDKKNIWRSPKTEKYNARIFIRDIISIELNDDANQDNEFF